LILISHPLSSWNIVTAALQGRDLPVVVRYSLRSIVMSHEKYSYFLCHPECNEGSYTSLYLITPLHQILRYAQDDRLVAITSK